MGTFDNFMIQYQHIDLMDINNIIFETLSEAGNDGTPPDIDGVEMVAPALFARGYIIVPIKKEVSNADEREYTIDLN